MMSPSANQHVASLEVVFVCVKGSVIGGGGGGGSPLGKAHLLSYYLDLPASMRAEMHIKSENHRLPAMRTAS